MELTLLGTVAVLAFVVGGAAVMLISAFRRTTELRGALIQAMRRIEKLEAAVAAGRPLDVRVTSVNITAAEETVASLAAQQPRLLEAPPTIEEIVAQAEAQDRIDPPHIAVLAFGAGLAAFASLAAAHVRALSTQGGLALAIAAGLAVIAAAEWRKRHDGETQPSPLLRPSSAALSALLGIIIIFAAILYGRWVLGALHPPAAVFALGALAVGAAALSLRYGAILLTAALVAMALAPAQSLIQAPGAWGQYAFLFVFTAAIAELARLRAAPLWAWLAMPIALFWGINAAIIGGEPFNVGVAGLYLAMLAALGFFYAWPAASALPFPRFWASAWREPMLVGHALALIAATALAALLLAHPAPVSFVGAALLALAAIAIGAAALRQGLWLAPVLAALSGAVVLAFWPAVDGIVDAPGVLMIAATLGLLFSLGGWAAMTSAADARAGAALAALTPVLIFAAAFWRIGGFGGAQAWAAAALVIGGINAISYLQLRRAKPQAASAFAAGAAFACAAAFTAITPEPYQALGLALSLPLIALAERWRDEPGLRFAAGALCVLVFARLFAPQIFVATAGPTWLIATLFAPAAAAALLASALFTRRNQIVAVAQGTFALALLLMATGISLIARHAFTVGAIGAPYASLAEAGLNTLIWLGAATIIAWWHGARPIFGLRALELLLFGAAATHALIVTGALINPWWGLAPAQVTGANFLNLIEFACLAPALLFFVYAWLRRRQGLIARAGASLGMGLVLVLLTLILELRRMFHGAAMASAPVTHPEAWAYSGAGLAFAALLLAIGADRNLLTLRYASLALALGALGKMAFSDLGALDGIIRIAGFLLIAAAAGGVVFFYRRFVLPPGPIRPKSLTDPKFVPPS